MSHDRRESDRRRLHDLLDRLAARPGGLRRLSECHGRLGWPRQGVYFFYEDGETGPDGRPRVVRVGMQRPDPDQPVHPVGGASQHRGNVGGRRPGGGNHRGSIFRLHVGAALIRRTGSPTTCLPQLLARPEPATLHPGERDVERAVSALIGRMPFTWLAVPTQPDGTSARGPSSATPTRSSPAYRQCGMARPQRDQRRRPELRALETSTMSPRPTTRVSSTTWSTTLTRRPRGSRRREGRHDLGDLERVEPERLARRVRSWFIR